MFRRLIVALSLMPLLSGATVPPDVVLTEAYRFGVDPSRLYTLAVRQGLTAKSELRLAPPAIVGVRGLDWSGHDSGRYRGLVELSGPKAIWSAQKTLPGTNLDFIAATVRVTPAPWPAMAPGPISFDMETFSVLSPPPKDEMTFADHADVVDWASNWASGAPSYGRLMRQALATIMQPPKAAMFGLRNETIAVDHAVITQAPNRQGRMILAVGRMDSDDNKAEKTYWTQSVFAILPDKGVKSRIDVIVPAFGPEADPGPERFRRSYRIVDLIDRNGTGTLDILLSVTDEKARHLELYGWNGRSYVLVTTSPRTGVPSLLDD
ncbi:MAG: hypothetical protein H7338_08790 [Candidatus Sericytochromatia bacterium]|nr:hypothetical protein [Candidatus Sericytochromatia bacterium]